MDKYLKETKMLDYSNANIQQLIRERRWKNINEFERLKSIYDFVRDEILFGYNIDAVSYTHLTLPTICSV